MADLFNCHPIIAIQTRWTAAFPVGACEAKLEFNISAKIVLFHVIHVTLWWQIIIEKESDIFAVCSRLQTRSLLKRQLNSEFVSYCLSSKMLHRNVSKEALLPVKIKDVCHMAKLTMRQSFWQTILCSIWYFFWSIQNATAVATPFLLEIGLLGYHQSQQSSTEFQVTLLFQVRNLFS